MRFPLKRNILNCIRWPFSTSRTFSAIVFSLIMMNQLFFTVIRIFCQFPFLHNFLPNDKILDWSRLKPFADNNVNRVHMMEFFFFRIENILGKEKMLVTSISFSFSQNVFNCLFFMVVKNRDCVIKI